VRVLRLLPLAALGYVCWANAGVLKKNLGALEKSLDVLGAVQGAASSTEMSEIARAVRMRYLETNALPLDNFGDFLRESMAQASGKRTRDPSRDLWGTPFRLEKTAGGFRVLSAGPDRAWGTHDDLSSEGVLDDLGGGSDAAPRPRRR
jgi:hypothetical protein